MRAPYIQRYPILDPVFQTLSALGAGLIVGGLTILLEPTWIIGIAFGIIAFLISLRKPEFVLLGVIFFSSTIVSEDIIPLVNLGDARVYITDFMLFGMIALIILRWLVRNKIDFQFTGLDLLIVLFIAWVYLATAIGFARGTVILKALIGPLRNISYFMIFFAITNLVKEKANVDTLIRGIFLLASLVAAVMILQYVLGTETVLLGGRVETLSTEGESFQGITRITDFSGEAIVLLAFIVKSVLVFMGPIRFKRVGDLLQWAFFGVAVVLTFNRNFWIGSSIAFFAFLIISGNVARQRFMKWVTVLILLALIILVPIFSIPQNKVAELISASATRFGSLFQIETFQASSSTSTFRWRDVEYPFAIEAIAENPLVGLGLGARYRPLVLGFDSEGFDGRAYIHNSHVGIMYQTGLVGYGFFAILSGVFVYRGFKYWRKVTDENLQGVVLGFTLTYISVLIGSITSPFLREFFWMPLIAIMWGVNELIFLHYVPKTKQDMIDSTAGEVSATKA